MSQENIGRYMPSRVWFYAKNLKDLGSSFSRKIEGFFFFNPSDYDEPFWVSSTG